MLWQAFLEGRDTVFHCVPHSQSIPKPKGLNKRNFLETLSPQESCCEFTAYFDDSATRMGEYASFMSWVNIFAGASTFSLCCSWCLLTTAVVYSYFPFLQWFAAGWLWVSFPGESPALGNVRCWYAHCTGECPMLPLLNLLYRLELRLHVLCEAVMHVRACAIEIYGWVQFVTLLSIYDCATNSTLDWNPRLIPWCWIPPRPDLWLMYATHVNQGVIIWMGQIFLFSASLSFAYVPTGIGLFAHEGLRIGQLL